MDLGGRIEVKLPGKLSKSNSSLISTTPRDSDPQHYVDSSSADIRDKWVGFVFGERYGFL